MSFFTYTLSSDEKDMLFSRVKKYTSSDDTELLCSEWTGPSDKDGYPMLRVTFRGKRIWLRVCRLIYFLHFNFELNSRYQVSHLCHNKKCVNIEHLNYETPVTNNQRKTCNSNRVCCCNHYGEPNCIF